MHDVYRTRGQTRSDVSDDMELYNPVPNQGKVTAPGDPSAFLEPRCLSRQRRGRLTRLLMGVMRPRCGRPG